MKRLILTIICVATIVFSGNTYCVKKKPKSTRSLPSARRVDAIEMKRANLEYLKKIAFMKGLIESKEIEEKCEVEKLNTDLLEIQINKPLFMQNIS